MIILIRSVSHGAPEEISTPDPQICSLVLYPQLEAALPLKLQFICATTGEPLGTNYHHGRKPMVVAVASQRPLGRGPTDLVSSRVSRNGRQPRLGWAAVWLFMSLAKLGTPSLFGRDA